MYFFTFLISTRSVFPLHTHLEEATILGLNSEIPKHIQTKITLYIIKLQNLNIINRNKLIEDF